MNGKWPGAQKPEVDLLVTRMGRSTQILRVGCAAFAVLPAFAGAFFYPVAPVLLVALLVLYGGVLWRWPLAWLVVLPVSVALFDLVTLSGRYFFNEFDFLVLVTLAVSYMRFGQSRLRPPIWRRGRWPIGLFLVCAVVSMVVGLLPLAPVGPNAFSNFFSNYNALRLGKAIVYGWLLLPVMEASLAQRGGRLMLVFGFAGAATAMGLIALWERGVFAALFVDFNFYRFANTVLDFSSNYRITGLFGEMNLGGTTIDGFLALTVPFAFAAVFQSVYLWSRALAPAAVLAGLYAGVVTFSRGLYGAILVGLVVYGGSMLGTTGRRIFAPKTGGGLIGAALACVLAFTLGYRFGGFVALVVAAAGSAVAVLLAYISAKTSLVKRMGRPALLVVCGLFFLALAYSLAGAIGDSKWSSVGAGEAWFYALVAAFFSVAGGVLAGRLAAAHVAPFSMASLLVIALILGGGTAITLGSYRVEERFSTTRADFAERMAHWRTVVEIRSPDVLRQLFGDGFGSFIRSYYWSAGAEDDMAAYRFAQLDGRDVLQLGAAPFNYEQRVSMEPNRSYTISVRAMARAMGGVSVKFCHKNLIFYLRYTPQCVEKVFRFSTPGVWEEQSAPFESGSLGRFGALYWPVKIMLNNMSDSVPLNIDRVSLTDESGKELIHNGAFTDAGDRWHVIDDFGHTTWHTKNMALHILFEQGYAGLLSFALLVVLAGVKLIRSMAREPREPLAPALLAALAGALTVGLFGTMIDSPRVATLFYLLLFFSASLPGATQAPAAAPDRLS